MNNKKYLITSALPYVNAVPHLGNLIGSNVFNIASVLGLTAMIKEIPVTEPQILSRDIFWMLAIAIGLLPLVFLPKRFIITRFKGLVLLLAYAVFIYIAFGG